MSSNKVVQNKALKVFLTALNRWPSEWTVHTGQSPHELTRPILVITQVDSIYQLSQTTSFASTIAANMLRVTSFPLSNSERTYWNYTVVLKKKDPTLAGLYPLRKPATIDLILKRLESGVADGH